MAKRPPKTSSQTPAKKLRKAAKPRGSRLSQVPEVVTPESLKEPEELEESAATEEIEAEYQELDGEDVAAEVGTNLPVPVEEAGLPAAPEPEAYVARSDLLRRYIDEISKYSLISPEEEFALAARLKETGDLTAAKRLVTANLRLVVKIAMEYRSAYQNVMDLIQEGNVGLMKAVSKFDPAKGAKLSYYASWWIRSYILKYILDNFRLVRVGTTQAQKKLFFHLMREKERLEAQGLEAGPKLLADRLHVREQDVIEMEQRLSGRGAEMSLNTPVGSADDTTRAPSHIDVLVDPAQAPDDQYVDSELRSILKERLEGFVQTLKEKELVVYRERLAADQPKTLQEIADQFGLTRERARQIEVRVIEKLRDYYRQYLE